MKRNKSFDGSNILYLIATPIGNLKEFPPRSIEIINNADLVAAEDTRNAFSLLSHFNIKKEIISLREHNEKEASLHVVSLIKQGKKVVYMSDAGYPGISDPGNILVKECIKNDIKVSTINGSSAFLSALVASGLPSDKFYFYGFLSAQQNLAKEELKKVSNYEDTLIFYESPHRILKTLNLLLEELGDRKAVIARELTKINEEFIRGNLSELVELDQNTLKGEMVIIIEGNHIKKSLSDDEIIAKVEYFTNKGMTKKDAINAVSDIFEINKNKIKDLFNY